MLAAILLGSRAFRSGLAGASALMCAFAMGVGCGGSSEGADVCEGAICPVPPGGQCTVEGATFESGATGIPAPDGCNTCSCQNGELACTLLGCVAPSCVYAGVERAHGSNFPSADACNTCHCEGGQVSCTERGCTTVPSACSYGGERIADGESRPSADGCNTCSCSNGQMLCTQRACQTGCSSNASCGDQRYCAFPDGMCSSNADRLTAPDPGGMQAPRGECRGRPDACTEDYTPVCGCDGVTYSNACAASNAGVNIASREACSN